MANSPRGQAGSASSVMRSSTSGPPASGSLKRKTLSHSLPQAGATQATSPHNVHGDPDPGAVKSPADNDDEPSSKRVKSTADTGTSSIPGSDSATVSLAKSSGKPRCPEYGVYITAKDLTSFLIVPHLAGYLKLNSTARVGDLWELCREQLWQLYQHYKSGYGGTVSTVSTDTARIGAAPFFKALDEGNLKIEDIKSIAEPSLVAFLQFNQKHDWRLLWRQLMQARFIHQVFEVVAASKEFPHVFSGAGPGQVGQVICADTLGWNTENAHRAITMWRVFLAEVRASGHPEGTFTLCTESIGQQVVRPVFSSGREHGKDGPPALVRQQVAQAAVNLSQTKPSTTAKAYDTMASDKQNGQATLHSTPKPQIRAPEDVARSFSELSVSVPDGLGDRQNAAAGARTGSQPRTKPTKQTLPTTSNSFGTAGVQHTDSPDRLFEQAKSSKQSPVQPLEAQQLAADIAELKRDSEATLTRIAMTDKEIEDANNILVDKKSATGRKEIESLQEEYARLKKLTAEVKAEEERKIAVLAAVNGNVAEEDAKHEYFWRRNV
ncbi:hypothetical protein LTR56_024070 [Elasticomyces elasticus]|nr:hypothetical protein LTR56_024070 [Elasticomyces elasticus]KAK3666631.1 hypothetical protein LTR22_002579 [Elasticomyces elasticus]KAK5758620.1 hypothetical protein LTS12_011320 [Elasticomyces elasticus]